MELTAVDDARAEVRRLGAALTAYELSHPPEAPTPVALLRELAAASRRLVDAIGRCVVEAEPAPGVATATVRRTA